jgi:DNA-binding NtrC family response regulator
MSHPARILVVEDRASLRSMVARLLADHEVDTAADAESARARLAAGGYDLVVTDVRLPDGDGFELLREIRARHPRTEIILMTAFASVEAAVEAVKAGAYDYVAKPFEPDELLLKVERALERGALRARAEAAEAALRRRDELEGLLGDSPAMARVRFLVERVCDLDVTVLLTGESGTGKEVAARAIHSAGDRRALPFVAVNCGAIPDHLVESELFGHAKGAFTGADQARAGLVEEAGDGTLFLDEIGDLPLDLQVTLNRAIQERVYRRVGEARERPLRARIVAATHHDLAKAVEEGRFREDLYFRLAVYPIELPPLRARGDDILLLAQHFVTRAGRRFDRTVSGFEPDALRLLTTYEWPGNVRELEHTIDRAVILAATERLTPTDLPEILHRSGGAVTDAPRLPGLARLTYKEAVEAGRERTVRHYLHALMRDHGGNVSRAARHAGVERESLHRMLRKAGIDAADYRGG